MGWRDLLQQRDEAVAVPWTGGRSLRLGPRAWAVDGRLPPEHGWHEFRTAGRRASWKGPCDPAPDVLMGFVKGYLIGDHVVPDGASVPASVEEMPALAEPVLLLDPGLERFSRISAGRACEDGPLVFRRLEFPLGPEDSVNGAFLDRLESVSGVPDVPPALDLAFRLESWRRADAERRRREEQELREREERRLRIVRQLGDGAGRRRIAVEDFETAARAALAVGGAELLDSRRSAQPGEMVVQFRLDGRRYECSCDGVTLRIIDSGICLTDHATGKKYDDHLTLESFPPVILQAVRERKLVVWRHVDDRGAVRDERDDEDWDD